MYVQFGIYYKGEKNITKLISDTLQMLSTKIIRLSLERTKPLRFWH